MFCGWGELKCGLFLPTIVRQRDREEDRTQGEKTAEECWAFSPEGQHVRPQHCLQSLRAGFPPGQRAPVLRTSSPRECSVFPVGWKNSLRERESQSCEALGILRHVFSTQLNCLARLPLPIEYRANCSAWHPKLSIIAPSILLQS